MPTINFGRVARGAACRIALPALLNFVAVVKCKFNQRGSIRRQIARIDQAGSMHCNLPQTLHSQ